MKAGAADGVMLAIKAQC